MAYGIEKPEYVKAKQYLDTGDAQFAPTTLVEQKALKTVKGQRNFNRRQSERAQETRDRRNADRIDGYDRDDLGDSGDR
jgi:hypothetical protein